VLHHAVHPLEGLLGDPLRESHRVRPVPGVLMERQRQQDGGRLQGLPSLLGVRLLVEGHAYDGFTTWLKKQRHRTQEPIGRLAEEVSTDRY
jgi:hypothetical protein